MDQLSLFQEIEEKIAYLHIVKDGKEVSMTLEELFDSKRFTDLYAVTFVASPKFFFQSTKEFKRINLILGIEDNETISSFTDGLYKLIDVEERSKFWNELDDEMKEKFLSNQYSIRFSQPGEAIHSKIYILHNPETDEKRVILGSANFTQKGFIREKQFEELIIYENDSNYFDTYMKRFQMLWSRTIDYIPERVRTMKKEELIIVSDPQVLTEVMLPDLEKNRQKIAVPEEVLQQVEVAPKQMERAKDKMLESRAIVELVLKKDTKNKVARPIPLAQLKSRFNKIQAAVTKTYKKNEHLDPRPPVFYNPVSSKLMMRVENRENDLVSFSEMASKEDLFQQLTLLHRFIDAYNLFTVKEDVINQKKIYEAIIYAFTSPFIWKMRDHYAMNASDSVRSSIPTILVLSGRSSSGKTTVLELIGLLMGHQPHYVSHERMSEAVIQALFESEMVLPMLIDEMKEAFFTGKKGERLIKYVSNELTGVHPCLIGTTNASNFSMPPQVARRIYYLEINNSFTEERYSESRRYLSKIHQQINSSLFKDFTYRMGEKIRNEEEFYREEDFLYTARQIFRNYYEELKIPIPRYFPDHLFNDYRDRGKLLWKELFRNYPDRFELYKDENKIFVDLDFLGKNGKEREAKIRFLPVECIIEDNSILILKKDLFLEYIGEKEKKGIFQRLFG